MSERSRREHKSKKKGRETVASSHSPQANGEAAQRATPRPHQSHSAIGPRRYLSSIYYEDRTSLGKYPQLGCKRIGQAGCVVRDQ